MKINESGPVLNTVKRDVLMIHIYESMPNGCEMLEGEFAFVLFDADHAPTGPPIFAHATTFLKPSASFLNPS